MVWGMPRGMYHTDINAFYIDERRKLKLAVRVLGIPALYKIFDIGAVSKDIAFITVIKRLIV